MLSFFKSKKASKSIILTGLLIATAGPAVAQDTKALTKVVEARQGYYKLIGLNMGALAGMAKGAVAYDAEAAKTHAGNLTTLTKYALGGLFVPGTSKDDLPGKTRALAKIWSDGAGVQEKGKAFSAAVAELEKAAGTSAEALGAAVKNLGGTCKGCHDNYRAKEF